MILIAEDQLITALELKTILKRNGYPITNVFTRGADAIKFLDTEKPLFALLDIKLSDDISGIEIGMKLKDKNIPFIFISAFSDPENLRRAKQLRPFGILTKPIDEMSLEHLIKDL